MLLFFFIFLSRCNMYGWSSHWLMTITIHLFFHSFLLLTGEAPPAHYGRETFIWGGRGNSQKRKWARWCILYSFLNSERFFWHHRPVFKSFQKRMCQIWNAYSNRHYLFPWRLIESQLQKICLGELIIGVVILCSNSTGERIRFAFQVWFCPHPSVYSVYKP